MKDLTGQKHGFSLRDVVPVLRLNLEPHITNHIEDSLKKLVSRLGQDDLYIWLHSSVG